jgi:LytS/YehU family sensor histidine kinase
MAPATGSQPVPVFLIQPLVENAIIHGFQESKRTFRLEIQTALEGDSLVVTVANTGVWKEKTPGDRQGVGLTNIRRRLELLYGSRASFKVQPDQGWVRVRIEIPRTV